MKPSDYQPEIISREAAFSQGRTRFYMGTTCKNGHTSERYVLNGACTECLNGRYRKRQHPYTRELEPWISNRFFVPRTFTLEDRQALEKYLQRCIMEYARAVGKLTPDVEDGIGWQLERM